MNGATNSFFSLAEIYSSSFAILHPPSCPVPPQASEASERARGGRLLSASLPGRVLGKTPPRAEVSVRCSVRTYPIWADSELLCPSIGVKVRGVTIRGGLKEEPLRLINPRENKSSNSVLMILFSRGFQLLRFFFNGRAPIRLLRSNGSQESPPPISLSSVPPSLPVTSRSVYVQHRGISNAPISPRSATTVATTCLDP